MQPASATATGRRPRSCFRRGRPDVFNMGELRRLRFCTICDQGYLARVLCLHDSISRSGEPFVLYVLCLDAPSERVVKALKSASLVAVPWAELKQSDPEYAAAQADRSAIEFIFTTKPVWVAHCLQRDEEASHMTYLDGDLWFEGAPAAVFDCQGDASVAITPHRFPRRLRERERYGVYNAGWVSFRRDENGLACLSWWRRQCLDWCRDLVEGERFTDQGYLGGFARQFAGVRVLEHPGINAAPWNVADHPVYRDGAGSTRIGDAPLLVYHFQGVREIVPGWFEPGLAQYNTPLAPGLRTHLYEPYLDRLAAQQAKLRAFGIRPEFANDRLNVGPSWRDRWERCKRRWITPVRGRWQGRLIHAPEPFAPWPILVVTPTLGDSPWLADTVASVTAQEMPCRHVLVCPADRLGALSARFPNIEVYPEPGGGMYAAINAGLAAAGEWGAFTYINDDDLLLPGFSRLAAAAQVGGERVVYGGVRLINTRGERAGAIPISPWSRLNRLLYAQRVEPVFQHGTIFTRAVYERIGGFDTDLKFCGDSELLARACVAQVPFHRASFGVVAAFRLRAGQLTKNLPVMLAEHHKLYAKLGLPAPRLTLKHRLARFVFLIGNLGVYLERIRRHGFVGFGEVLAKVE